MLFRSGGAHGTRPLWLGLLSDQVLPAPERAFINTQDGDEALLGPAIPTRPARQGQTAQAQSPFPLPALLLPGDVAVAALVARAGHAVAVRDREQYLMTQQPSLAGTAARIGVDRSPSDDQCRFFWIRLSLVPMPAAMSSSRR